MNLGTDFRWLDWICFALLIVGAINWGFVGILETNLLAVAFDAVFQPGPSELLQRIVYALVGLAGLYFFLPLYRFSRRDTGHRSPSRS